MKKVAILQNENPESGKKWELACQKLNVPYVLIDLTASDWFLRVSEKDIFLFLLRPSGSLFHYKTLYDERLYIISKVLKRPTFPSYEECYIYENKRLLSYFLQAQQIPHPVTSIFYDKKEALDFVANAQMPLVAKTSIGASGSGVLICKTKEQASKHIQAAFSKKGIKRRFGPNRSTGTPSGWLKKAFNSPDYLKKKLKEYLAIYSHGERDFVIFQAYIPHNYEWRMVKIGDSYFGHQKVKQGEKASGTKGVDYVAPPISLLDFTRKLCEKHDFQSMAVDVFEDGEGVYLVNELQTIFGHVQDHILEVNGQPGRYLFQNKQWVFEPGDFNTNESYDLRLETALNLYKNA